MNITDGDESKKSKSSPERTPKEDERVLRVLPGEPSRPVSQREELERRVAARTAELARINKALREEIEDLQGAEQALREIDARFRQFMSNLPGLALIKDSQGRYLYAEGLEAGGKGLPPREEFLGRTDYQIFPPDVAHLMVEHDREVLANLKPVQVVEMAPRGGGMGYWLVVKFPVFSEHGQVLVGAIAVDITEQSVYMEALERAITVLEQTKGAFKSKLLGRLRQDLEEVLRLRPRP